MILNIDENFEKPLFEKVVEFYNKPTDEKRIIYLRSNGGEKQVAHAIADIIMGSNTELVAYDYICSAAFNFFFNAKCDKRLIYGCKGCFHQSRVKIHLNESNRAEYNDEIAAKISITSFAKSESDNFMFKLKFTKKEISSVRQDKDVWFQYDRMKELLQNSLHNNS